MNCGFPPSTKKSFKFNCIQNGARIEKISIKQTEIIVAFNKPKQVCLK